MKNKNSVWDTLAYKYDSLWVQKYSLSPTRKKVMEYIDKLYKSENKIKSILDLGCGTGQLLKEISEKYEYISLTGVDKSQNMIEEAIKKVTSAKFFCKNISFDNTDEFSDKETIDLITCCHSFPYYKSKPEVLKKLQYILRDSGHIIFVQASINNLYDKIIMYFTEKTAEKADYLSVSDFEKLVSDYFLIEEKFLIKEKFFMPSICGFILRKK